MERLISESIANPNDPGRKELEMMERQKSMIDEKAKAQVRCELYCGLGFLTAQTIGLMRLTFWNGTPSTTIQYFLHLFISLLSFSNI